ncbi:lipopolysaccharide biosynthesis protein [Gordonia araii]|uniref:lipopolysaccharide biosynthesis protein n=1 Tax=Gordonia araii TaxID=263909 RepID=UPI0002E01778|nr:polysaccharide biosynthesis protein [Gordonia araii]NNG96007.1 polysaccharide biosynthesis protein [Gordonia araii NBRC 100433]
MKAVGGGSAASRRGAALRSVGAVTVGAMVANVAAYLVAIPASRALGAADYGVFGVIMAAMVVVAAPSMAVQAVIAREVVRGRSGLARLGWQTALLVAVTAAVAGAVLVPLTRVPVTAAIAGLVMAPLITLTAAAQGFLQGRHEFRRLGWLLGMVGLLRSVPMIVALLLGDSATGALWVGAGGTLVAALLAWRSAAPRSPTVDLATIEQGQPSTVGGGSGVWSVLAASQVQLALLVAVSLDLLLARVVLSDADAGVYALGAVATKAAFWLPQAIGTVVYPRLAAPASGNRSGATRSLRIALAVVTGIGAVVVTGTWLVSPLVPHIVGDDYRPLTGFLWMFSATGAILAILALLLLAVIAVRRTVIGVAVWVSVAIEATVMLVWADSVTTLIAIAAASAAVMALLCLALVAAQGASTSGREALAGDS